MDYAVLYCKIYLEDVIYSIRRFPPYPRLKKQLSIKLHCIIVLLKVSISFKVLKFEIFILFFFLVPVTLDAHRVALEYALWPEYVIDQNLLIFAV